MIADIILGICAFGILVCIFALIRNQWVFKQRTAFLDRHDLEGYDELKNYDSMYYRFWIWDINKLKK